MGCCCGKAGDVIENTNKPIVENEENILDSPFTKEARRSLEGVLIPGQIPKVVSNAYDNILEDEYLDVSDFRANTIIANPYMKPWAETIVEPSQYLINDMNYLNPEPRDLQPEYLTDMSQGLLTLFNTNTRQLCQFENKIFSSSARAIYLPTGIVLICGGRGTKASFGIDVELGKIIEYKNMFEMREFHSLAILNNSVFATGGFGSEELSSCEMFYNDFWCRQADMNHNRSFHSSIGLENCVYVCGGMRQESIEKWSDGKWIILSVRLDGPTSRAGICAMSAFSFIVFGGEESVKGYRLAAWEVDVNRFIMKPLKNIEQIAVFESCGSYFEGMLVFYSGGIVYVYNSKKQEWEIGNL